MSGPSFPELEKKMWKPGSGDLRAGGQPWVCPRRPALLRATALLAPPCVSSPPPFHKGKLRPRAVPASVEEWVPDRIPEGNRIIFLVSWRPIQRETGCNHSWRELVRSEEVPSGAGEPGRGPGGLKEHLGALVLDLETRSDVCGWARVQPSCTGGVCFCRERLHELSGKFV